MYTIIEKSLANSFSYQEYRNYVTLMSDEGKTTGHEQTEALVNYTKLNESRLHRLDKTMVVVDEVKTFLENLDKDYIWLVISESWCGDAAQILPIINKMAEVSDKIDLRVVLRDDNEDLMNLFLTNGTRSIPKLIIIDKNTNEVIADFGPRPKEAKQLILDYKAEHGVVDETAKINLQKWYLNDKGISTQKEIVALMM
ncbi:thioredoxin family protein [Flavobacterium sp.]|uniref:thioredoxin family protein n=1 Tax=Flavobacterium sp. TaxID=239 RepID=UPI000EC9B4BC|nr:thioredoxin family protein [Flavobacterium sp.]HCQ11723.1 thioredoxin family protein [Flavobacterium sp.]